MLSNNTQTEVFFCGVITNCPETQHRVDDGLISSSILKKKKQMVIIFAPFFLLLLFIVSNQTSRVSISSAQQISAYSHFMEQEEKDGVNFHRMLMNLANDPKTVITKDDPESDARSRRSSARGNILRNGTESRVPMRFLSFGTSQTWGAGLENRELEAYPFLLDPYARNAAIRATGPEYPSMCLNSLMDSNGVDNTIYDVVTLEFFPTNPYYLRGLARRVRERYPDAIIILYRILTPREMVVAGESIFQLMNKQLHENAEELQKFMDEHGEAVSWNPSLRQMSEEVQEIANEVGGFVFDLKMALRASKAYQKRSDWFGATDMHHLSVKGHIAVAQGIKKLVKEALAQKSYPLEPRLGTYGAGDDCTNWFLDPSAYNAKYTDPNVQINPMYSDVGNTKFTLEIGQGGGEIVVTNKFEGDRFLLLSYMTILGLPNDYPNAVVTLTTSIGTVYEAELNQEDYNLPTIHISTVGKIGLISPGDNIVRFDFFGPQKKLPFRVVAIEIVPVESVEIYDV